MFGRIRWQRWLFGAALAAAVEGVAVLALTLAASVPAQAQWGDSQHDFFRRQYQRQQRERGGLFGIFGGWGNQPSRRYRERSDSQRQGDYSRAPTPRKQESQPDPNKPITTIVVMGGSMADWLAYGLEAAFSDSPNVEIVRKDQPHSGLLRYKAKSDLDWWHVARDELVQQKANYVVMMLGVTDRQNIRESDAEKEKEQETQKNAPLQLNGTGAAKTDQTKDAKEKEKKTTQAKGVIEFRSDQWEKVYTRRIDKTIAALKSRGVPAFWVGLPSIRGTKSTADAVYLNNLYRARAQRAGVVYIDVWDGFVDDAGKYSSYGPDLEGQTRRLRSGDGVFFTKYGARKLAHYIEREIRRYMTNRVTTLTFPTGPLGPGPGAGGSAVRPVAGPVLPLTTLTGTSDLLLGGAGMRPARSDATATEVLVKGDALRAPPGRADDFKWPPNSEEYGKPPPPPPAAKKKPAKIGPAAAAPTTPAAGTPQTQASAPSAAVPLTPAPAIESKNSAADTAAKKPAEEEAQAEARRRAAEKTRAEAQHSASEQGLRPPARIETRPQQAQRRQPRRRSDDPFRSLFGLLPR